MKTRSFSLRSRGRSPRYTTVLFIGFATVAVAALIWTAERLARMDRVLEARQLEERRAAAADRIVVSLGQALLAEERRLTDLPGTEPLPPGSGAAQLLAGPSEVRVWPEHGLLYYPVAPAGREAPGHLYAEAEKREFVDGDYRRAASALSDLARSSDPAIRAGAQIRLARNLRKAGDGEAALKVYGGLIASPPDGISFAGVPVELAARRARCVLLEDLGRDEALTQEVASLDEALRAGRWRLDRETYLFYRGEMGRWLGRAPEEDQERLALAEAVLWLWQNRQALAEVERGTSGRSVFRGHGAAVVVLWRVLNKELTALAAGPAYQRGRWLEPVLLGPEFSDVGAALRDEDGSLVLGREPGPESGPVTFRPASLSGLPWSVEVFAADDAEIAAQFAQRRRLMTAGLAILALIVLAASYFFGRAVSRELAAARLQSDFVSAVSHEFRTPLTSMRQFTEMLVEDEGLGPEKRRAYYGAQERATRRLSRLVESLLDFGRMEAGARPYRLERIDAGRLAASTLEEFRQVSGADGLVAECAVPDEGPAVDADRDALVQALWNLLDNAVKYSEARPFVRVEVEDGDPVAIRVRDRGVGIPPSERKRIFRKFVRGSSAGATGIKGTGIGLAMVKHIVDAHGGKVLVDEAPGGGTVFTIQLPRGG
jgi:signal transduction histidine kinase